MSKPKLKLVEPSLQEHLESTIALAAKLREAHSNAAKAFKEKYPEDSRFVMDDLSGTVLVDSDRDPDDPSAAQESKRSAYLRDRETLEDLWRQVREADNAIGPLRTRVDAAVTEQERRAALAGAIAEAQKADTALQNLRAIIVRADNAVTDAEERHGSAVKAVTTASETHARLFEAAIEQGHPPGRDSAVREARRLADDAGDELAVAKAAATAMRAKLGNAEYRLEQAHKAVVDGAQNVAVVELPRLLAEAKHLQSELEGRREVLSALSQMFNRRVINRVDRQLDVEEFLEARVFPYTWNGGRTEDHPDVAPWLEAVEALQIDADAPLPTV
jgi:hypothetical protein